MYYVYSLFHEIMPGGLNHLQRLLLHAFWIFKSISASIKNDISHINCRWTLLYRTVEIAVFRYYISIIQTDIIICPTLRLLSSFFKLFHFWKQTSKKSA